MSPVALPRPGKCLSVAITPALVQAGNHAAAISMTTSGSAEKLRPSAPIDGLSGLTLTSTTGARLRLMPSLRERRAGGGTDPARAFGRRAGTDLRLRRRRRKAVVRAEPRHLAALLVDGDQERAVAGGLAQGTGERGQLVVRLTMLRANRITPPIPSSDGASHRAVGRKPRPAIADDQHSGRRAAQRQRRRRRVGDRCGLGGRSDVRVGVGWRVGLGPSAADVGVGSATAAQAAASGAGGGDAPTTNLATAESRCGFSRA